MVAIADKVAAGLDLLRSRLTPPPPPPPPPPAPPPEPVQAKAIPEPGYHPQVAPAPAVAPSAGSSGNPAPAGLTINDAAPPVGHPAGPTGLRPESGPPAGHPAGPAAGPAAVPSALASVSGPPAGHPAGPAADTRTGSPTAAPPVGHPAGAPFAGDFPPTIPGGIPPAAAGGEYGIPIGSTLRDVATGTQGHPFDMTLSQLSAAVYDHPGRGGPPEGWNRVDNDMLAQRLGSDGQPATAEQVQEWRLQTLGFNDTVKMNEHEFRAEVYTDNRNNFVLSYRGTADGPADWNNNGRGGVGLKTDPPPDKFAVVATETGHEFARVFGDNPDGRSNNLAMTGHSQGGGLATAGSLATGIPAATFNGSGLHPMTLDRIHLGPDGIAPVSGSADITQRDPQARIDARQAARDIAEGGQIRAYSISPDAVTNVQDAWVTGWVAPDALGKQIVVDPAAEDKRGMIINYGFEKDLDYQEAVGLYRRVEEMRDPTVPVLFTMLGGPLGGLAGSGVSFAGDAIYGGFSHSPGALTKAMAEHQPWQPGYENPTSLGREIQDLRSDQVKDYDSLRFSALFNPEARDIWTQEMSLNLDKGQPGMTSGMNLPHQE